MNTDNDIFSKLIEEDKDEFNIFLDTLQKIFEEDLKKGIKPYER